MTDLSGAILAGGLGFFASTGLEWSSGDYGLEDDTTAVIAPVSLEFNRGPVFLRASSSYARLDGPADVLLIDAAPQAARRGGGALPGDAARSGWGDLALSAGYGFSPEAAPRWLIDVSAGVELPTGDETDGFGTGGTDFFAGLDLVYDADAVVWSSSLGYQMTDDADGRVFDDPWSAGISATARLGGDAYLGAALDARQAITPEADDTADLTVFAGRPLAGPVSIGAHVFTGLTDASADVGAGVTLSWSR